MPIHFVICSDDSFCILFLSGGPRVLTNMSSGDIQAKEGDLVNLLCSAQGEPPITLSWEKDQKPLEGFAVAIEEPHRSSFLVVNVKDERNFGTYICRIRDRFQSTDHTILVEKETKGIIPFSLWILNKFYKSKPNENRRNIRMYKMIYSSTRILPVSFTTFMATTQDTSRRKIFNFALKL